MTSETMDDLVPLSDDEPQQNGFRHVLRGYDPRQVEEYLDRVEAALNDADERHAEDGRRVAALEQQVGELTARLGEAERRASGRPEPAALVGERLRAMLELAEQEAAEIRASARQEADALLGAAQEQAAADTAERTKSLEKREREVEAAHREAEAARLEAQRDAEAVRSRASREAERELEKASARAEALRVDAEREAAKALDTARDDVRLLHEQTQRESAQARTDAQREVRELTRQRDTLVSQLATLRDAIAAAVGPLGGVPSSPADSEDPAPKKRRPGSARVEPGA
jgi:DivIVA domain-containing protein